MSYELFDQLDVVSYSPRNDKPIWTYDLEDKDQEDDIRKWLNTELDWLDDGNRERYRQIERNLALYKGIQFIEQEVRDTRADRRDILQIREGISPYRVPRIVINQTYDLTTNLVSRLVKWKPAVIVQPVHNEHSDKISAKWNESLLKHIWYKEKFQTKWVQQCAKAAKVMGEAYLFIQWDPDAGPEHPAEAELEKAGKSGGQKTLRDGSGEILRSDSGEPIKLDRTVKIGDVTYMLKYPTEVRVERKPRWEESDYLFYQEIMHVEEAKARWPKAADSIKANEDIKLYDYEKMQTVSARDSVIVWHYWHKKTPMLSGGRYIAFTRETILENVEHPYKDGKIPCVRLTDIDRPGELHGYSFIENISTIIAAYNQTTQQIVKNQFLTAHPKWVFPAGSVKIDHLAADITIVQYKGQVPPQLMQNNPTPAEMFEFRNNLKEDMQQIAGVFGVSRGEPPAGVKAGVAMQFLNEQENERHNEMILKWNDWLVDVAEMTLSRAGQYYDHEDQRTLNIVGEENAWMSGFFDPDHLTKPYVVRLQNASALPESKAAKMQTVLDLHERFPDAVSPEQVLDMLDMAQPDKFVDYVTASIRAAEAENESMRMHGDGHDPEEHEHHIEHWQIHMKSVLDYSWRLLPDKNQKTIRGHIMAHEMYMFEKALNNPAFEEKLRGLDLFPVFFVPPAPEPMVPEAMDPAMPAAGGGGGEMGLPPEMLNNPDLGGEEQLPVNPDLAPGEVLPPPPPNPEPSRSI